jgi:hypothetical protein
LAATGPVCTWTLAVRRSAPPAPRRRTNAPAPARARPRSRRTPVTAPPPAARSAAAGRVAGEPAGCPWQDSVTLPRRPFVPVTVQVLVPHPRPAAKRPAGRRARSRGGAGGTVGVSCRRMRPRRTPGRATRTHASSSASPLVRPGEQPPCRARAAALRGRPGSADYLRRRSFCGSGGVSSAGPERARASDARTPRRGSETARAGGIRLAEEAAEQTAAHDAPRRRRWSRRGWRRACR